MAEIGNWPDQDSEKYVGKIDRVYTSMTQYHGAEYFIDEFLRTRGFTLSHRNRSLIAAELEKYDGEHPYRKEELTYFLDRRIR